MSALLAKSKDIFLKAIIAYARVFATPTKYNTQDFLTHAWIDVLGDLNRYNKGTRENLFEAVAHIVPYEVSHDSFYRDRMQFVLERVVFKILDGEWEPRGPGRPDPTFWVEPPPYGGQESIVHKLGQHGEEIKKLIGVA